MKTLVSTDKLQQDKGLQPLTHWLSELLFGAGGALVLVVIIATSINHAAANDSDIGSALSMQPANTTDAANITNSAKTTNKASITNTTLIQVGSADMSLLWFDIYTAKLFSLDGKYQANRFPMILDIQYHRDIQAPDLVDATIEQWQHLGLTEDDISLLSQQLVRAWPDVKQGDRLTFRVNNPNDAAFLLNDTPYYQVSNAQFPEAFLDIWLSEKTSHPKLRKQLIGAN
ncbi:MAG: chalcone isomerase family protein [Shewanella psychromarinicola]|uniref:chalcone isomerase family protein n=1 Tax=Shewanella psychromarinicola TaxID=2487742 RepID=UPI0030035A61|tara:strand:+ start:35816 stop:36502 length:687 start_codon:yes stop_codon:yes gene_type:complete